MKNTLVLLALALTVSGCRWEADAEVRFVNAVARAKMESVDPCGPRVPPSREAGAEEATDPDESDSDSMIITGKVAERIDVSGYSYLRVTTAHGDLWTAVPRAALHVGDPVTIDGELTMENFESKTLKRTFDRIIFGTIHGTHPLRELEEVAASVKIA